MRRIKRCRILPRLKGSINCKGKEWETEKRGDTLLVKRKAVLNERKTINRTGVRLEKGMENYSRKGVKTGGEGWEPTDGRLVRKMGINLMKRMWL